MNHHIVRGWKWISNSRTDCIDFWCSIVIFISGFFLLFQDPDRFPKYTYFEGATVTKNVSAALFSSIGLVNLIRLFNPHRLPILVRVGMQSLNLMVFLLLTFCELANLHSFPLTIVFYSVFSLMAVQNILKAR